MSQITTQVQPDILLNDREQVQYLLGNPPTWMMRYGIGAMAVFFAIVLGLSYIIHFPNVIETKITLTTAYPPIRVLASETGRISDFLVTTNQQVEQGQLVAVMENTAKWQDVCRLESWLRDYAGQQDTLPTEMKLGDLQPLWSVFSQHWKENRYLNTNGHTVARVTALKGQIEQLERINTNLSRQKVIQKEEFELSTKEQERQRQLLVQGVISAVEAEKTQTTWLQQKRQIVSSEAAVLQNQMQIKQMQNQIAELNLSHSDNENTQVLTLAEDTQRLLSAIQAWKQRFMIFAPISGHISLDKIWSAAQNIMAQEEIMAVVPEVQASAFNMVLGKANIVGSGIGKVKPGDKVIVRLDAYSTQQYGVLEGTVSTIAALPQAEAGYAVDIALPTPLQTNNNKIIPFRQEMAGNARIITEDRRVIERIFDQIGDLLSNH